MTTLKTVKVQLPSEIAAQMMESLRRFGLSDIPVVGRALLVKGDRQATPIRMIETGVTTVTQLCAQADLWREHVIPRNRVTAYERVDGMIKVFHQNAPIGTIDINDVFSYSAAPDLRTCLGWVVATDIGRQGEFDYDLDLAVKAIAESVQGLGDLSTVEHGQLVHIFSNGPFNEAVRAHLYKNYGSRLIGSGSTQEAKSAIWQVAVRMLLGQEHEGFIFSRD